MIQKDRMTAPNDQEIVVFIIGMRLNKLWKVHKWWPAFSAMPKMLKELLSNPQSGLLHAEMRLGRSPMLVQYWESVDQLMNYATNKDQEHVPAWRQFNRSVGPNGDVGIWHETYTVSAGAYECVYVNMPPTGLGKARGTYPAKGRHATARGRLGHTPEPTAIEGLN